jgi:uncharacterized protein (DUF2236 family)
MHRDITGVGFDGASYHALDPEPYAWTHLSNFDAALVMRALFTEPLDQAQQHRLYAEWRQIGLLLGIPDSQLPANLNAFHAYVANMVATRLDDNEVARQLLRLLALRGVAAPPWLRGTLLRDALWPAIRPIGGSVLLTATVGTLPPLLREKLELSWSVGQQRRLELLAAGVRLATRLVPERVRDYPIAYRARQQALTHTRAG